MTKPSHILGMNARVRYFGAINSAKVHKIANSKLLTKKYLSEAGVPVPQRYAIFSSMEKVRGFDFSSIKSSFVVKPSAGSGGKGIVIIRKPSKEEGKWLDIENRVWTESDLKLHIGDILDGQYSVFGTKHRAFVEERVPVLTRFRKYVHKGSPDIRVLVYNKVPVMAMLRLPTRESEGRANLHQGAIGAGVDIATGVTLKGVRRGKQITYVPGSKRKINGLRIPQWSSILTVAVEAANVVEMAFGGVDILLHEEKGPMVVELNASPGLDIQLANRSGLKWRLERVEGVRIRDVEHGVRVGKALFAETFADKVKARDGLVIVNTTETIRLRRNDKKIHEAQAFVDTGVLRSKIDVKLAEEAGLLDESNVLWETPPLGKTRRRKVIGVRFYLKDQRIKTIMSVVNRSRSKSKVVIGRKDLQGFLVNPQVVKK